MQIQIHTDSSIEGREAFNLYVRGEVEAALDHVSSHITRVEAHLSDENGGKPGSNDKRCMLEARLEGHQPLAVTHHADTVALALAGATDKLNRMIESTLGRLRDEARHRTDPFVPEPDSMAE